MELSSSELELNCLYRNWNWSGIAFIGIGIGIELPCGLGTGCGIGVELPLTELELELNCKNEIDPSSAVLTVHFAVTETEAAVAGSSMEVEARCSVVVETAVVVDVVDGSSAK